MYVKAVIIGTKFSLTAQFSDDSSQCIILIISAESCSSHRHCALVKRCDDTNHIASKHRPCISIRLFRHPSKYLSSDVNTMPAVAAAAAAAYAYVDDTIAAATGLEACSLQPQQEKALNKRATPHEINWRVVATLEAVRC